MSTTPAKRQAAAALREIIAAARKYIEAEQAIVADLKEPAREHGAVAREAAQGKEAART